MLKEHQYFTPVSAADAAVDVILPLGEKTTMDKINYDPRDAIKGLLRRMQARWDPGVIGISLLSAMTRHAPALKA